MVGFLWMPINVTTGEKQNDERQGYLVNLISIAEKEQTGVFWRGWPKLSIYSMNKYTLHDA